MSLLHNSSTEKVRVVCRVRPANLLESSKNGVSCVKLADQNIELQVDETAHNFQFDRVFGPESTQVSVFEYTATPLILDVLNGYNATIFAYGQTGSGKTHTMEGAINDENLRGIIPRAVEALFDAVSEADESIEFTFKVTYVEIYMEKVRDLLDETRTKVNLTIREDKIKGIYISDVTEEYVTSQDELLEIMADGAQNRATAATGMNEGSSRSHSVFTVTVTQKDTRNGVMKCGKLVLVDLAGSEMVRKTNASGQQLEEAKTINKSLSALGQVINALTDKNQTHVPYRDSKLTRILQDSLGGNSKTVLIVAMSPSSYNAPESLSTLRFGMRAKSIENKVTVNQTRTPEELEALLVKAEQAIDAQSAHILALQAEVEALKGSDAGFAGSGGGGGASDAQLKVIKQLEETVTKLTDELEEERADGARKNAEVSLLTQKIKEKEKLLAEAGELMREAQRHYEAQRTKADQLVREKAVSEGAFQRERDELQAELDKVRFELQEVQVSVDTLRNENRQLALEIEEISGDTVGEGAGGERRTAAASKSRMRSDMGADAFEGSAGSASGSAATTTIDTAVSGGAVISEAERQNRADQAKKMLTSVCWENGIAPEGKAGAALRTWLDGFTTQQESMVRAFEARLQTVEKAHGEQSRRVKELEVQRTRIETDLKNRTLKMTQMQVEINNMRNADNSTASQLLSEREKALAKSLQQRLEQLVAVHRQLLRKFALLELECGELKKKILLRDERIKQLETNARSVTGNLRAQSERHIAELTALKEQIEILRQEQQERMDAIGASASAGRYQPGGPSPVGSKRTVRGGAHHSVIGGAGAAGVEDHKSVRGGGTGVGVSAGRGGSSPSSGTGLSLRGPLSDLDNELMALNSSEDSAEVDEYGTGAGLATGGSASTGVETVKQSNTHAPSPTSSSGDSSRQPITAKRRPSGMLGMISKAFGGNK